jgi:hypothetical protein
MAARLWTALLVLAGVFAMHGLQCSTGADSAGHPASPAGHAEAFFLAVTAVAPDHPHAVAPAGIAQASAPMVAVPVAGQAGSGPGSLTGAAPEPAEVAYGGTSHDWAARVWTLCLAVLAAGLAVLLVPLVSRPVMRAAPALGYGRAQLWSPAPSRPPDLSALCLLRI